MPAPDLELLQAQLRTSHAETEREAQALLAQYNHPFMLAFPSLRKAMSLVAFQHLELADSFGKAADALESESPDALADAVSALSSPLPYGLDDPVDTSVVGGALPH